MENTQISYKSQALKNGKQSLALQSVTVLAFIGMMLVRIDDVVFAFAFFAFFATLVMLGLIVDYRGANRLPLYPRGLISVGLNYMNYLMLIYLFDYLPVLFMAVSVLMIGVSSVLLIKAYHQAKTLDEEDYISYIRDYPITLDTMKRHVFVTMVERLKRVFYLGILYAIIVSLFPEAHASFMVLFLMIVCWQVAMSFYLFKYDKWFTIRYLLHLTVWIVVHYLLVFSERLSSDIMGAMLFVLVAYAPLYLFVNRIESQLRKLDEKQPLTKNLSS